VLVTGWGREIAQSDPRAAYIDGILAKPVDPQALLALVTGSRATSRDAARGTALRARVPTVAPTVVPRRWGPARSPPLSRAVLV